MGSGRCSPENASTSQSAVLPERFEMNAIMRPSGDQRGLVLS